MEFNDSTTVVIPAKNESESLAILLPKVLNFVKRVIVVDGHSHDGTIDIAKRYGAEVIQDNRLGKGDALRAAIPHVKTEYTLFMDADGSHDANDIPRLIQPLIEQGFDHVSGSRLIGAGTARSLTPE